MDVGGQLHTLPSLIQVKKPGTPQLVQTREKFVFIIEFEPWTIQMMKQTLYTPKHHGSQNITLEQVMMAGLCHFRTLKETLSPPQEAGFRPRPSIPQ
jgi:hypothetical protein